MVNLPQKSNSLRSILVLGSDTRSFLSAVRSFGRAGFKVDVGWVDYRSPALKSHYINEVVIIPVYSQKSKAWINVLNCLVRERNYDFVVGCHDQQVLPLQYHRAELEQPDRFALIPDNAFDVSFNKKLTHELACKLGISVPEQYIAYSQANISSVMFDWQSVVYIKPLRSTNIDNVACRTEVIRVDHPDAIPSFDDETLKNGLLVQRAVMGRGVGIVLLAKEGKILTAFQHERIHEPPSGGGSSYRRSIPLDKGMLEASKKMVHALEYTGVAMFEFKYCAITDKWWLMEVNGRFWGSMPLTLAAGIDMPLYWYQMLRQGREDFPQKYRSNIYCRSWKADRYWLQHNMVAKCTNKKLLTVSLPSILAEVRHVVLGRERSDTFVWDDPQPAFEELKQIFFEPIDVRLRRLKFTQFIVKVKAERAIASAGSILFVCHGNICRSPFAEIIAQQLTTLPVNSAGTHPLGGRSCPSEAIQAATSQGVKLCDHRSRTLDNSMIDAADIIFVFDVRNERDILAKFPYARSKVYQIACLDDGKYDVADPYGDGIAAFENCYKRLAKLVGRICYLSGTRHD